MLFKQARQPILLSLAIETILLSPFSIGSTGWVSIPLATSKCINPFVRPYTDLKAAWKALERELQVPVG